MREMWATNYLQAKHPALDQMTFYFQHPLREECVSLAKIDKINHSETVLAKT